MLKSSLSIAQAAAKFLGRQGLKAGASTPSYLPSLYNPATGMPQVETFLIGAAKAFKTLTNQTFNPFSMRSAEAFKNTGLALNQQQVLRSNPDLIAKILKDPKNWRSGEVGKSFTIPSRQLKNGRWTKPRKVKLTDEAQSAVTPLVKDLHATPYFAQANINRTGVTPKNTIVSDIFNKIYGKNISKTSAAKLTGNKAVLDDIIRFEGLDPKTLKIMELNKGSLNNLHRDVQFSKQFRQMAGITFNRKFKNKDDLMGYLVSNGFNPGQVKKVGNYVMVNYSPQFKSNFYTGGINARVLLKPSEPGKAYLIPNDVYDIYGRGFDKLIAKGLGFKNQNLNVMGMKKIDIPDPSNWNKSFVEVNKKIAAKTKRDAKKYKKQTDSIKTMKKKYKNTEAPTDNELVYRNTQLTKKQLEGNKEIVDVLDNTPITAGRVAKWGVATGGVGGGLFATGASLLGDDDE